MENITTALPDLGDKGQLRFAGNDEVKDLKKKFVLLLESKGFEEFVGIIAMAESVD
jgi:hypothetical protein